jgi:HEAT repeat protein
MSEVRRKDEGGRLHLSADELPKKLVRPAAARLREEKDPEPGDPAYLDKQADRMLSNNLSYRSSAIDALLKADPATASPETTKKVARAFKTLAECDPTFERESVVQGLAKWAGRYSVPILLEMLNKGDPLDQEPEIRALAAIKDARAAPALVARLSASSFEIRSAARVALLEMGCDAEDALLAAGDSEDPETRAAALTLLGDIGTEKSLDLLRRMLASHDPDVRSTAVAAMAKINRRFRANAKPENQ